MEQEWIDKFQNLQREKNELHEKYQKLLEYQSKFLDFQEFHEDQVQMGKLLGRGSFATVYSCILKINNGMYAAKCIQMHPSLTEPVKQEFLKVWQQEIEVLRNRKNENIVKLVGFIRKADELVLIMDMYDSNMRKYLTEKYECWISQQVSGALFC